MIVLGFLVLKNKFLPMHLPINYNSYDEIQ